MHYSFIFQSEKNIFHKSIEISDTKIENYKSFSCQVYKDKDNNIINIICFYIIKPNLYAERFDINHNFTSDGKTYISCNCDIINNNFISIISSKSEFRNQFLICWEQKDNNAYFIIYDNNSFIETSKRYFNECDTNEQLMDTYYYEDNFIFICQLKRDKNQYLFLERPFNQDILNNRNEHQINETGFLINDDLYWFFNKSNDLFNFNSYTCPLNYSDENDYNPTSLN